MKVSAARLDEAAVNPDLALRWPSMRPKLTGEAADAEDKFRLENGLKSRTQILIERDDMTRPEAEAYLEETAEDLKREAAMLADATPEEEPDPDAPPEKTSTGNSADDEDDDTPDATDD
jgi:hypothetical protein